MLLANFNHSEELLPDRMGLSSSTMELAVTEAHLRDALSKRLDLLEPGLALRGVEFRLPNRNGASGSIDILATDRFAATVIIELKKTNQALPAI